MRGRHLAERASRRLAARAVRLVHTSFRGRAFRLGVTGELEAFNGGGALLADVADDIGNGIGLVAEMSVGYIGHAESGHAVACCWVLQ